MESVRPISPFYLPSDPPSQDVTMYQRSSTCVMSTGALLNIGFRGIVLLSSPPPADINHGRKIAFYAEDAPPTDIADRLVASFPHFMSVGISQRSTQAAVEYDK